MEVAVGVSRKRLFISEGKGHNGRLADRQALALTALVGLEIDPKDAMLLGHRMLHAANGHGNGIPFNGNDGNMLFVAGLYHTGLQLGHFFAAAHHGNTCIVDHADQISAMLANIKLVVIAHKKTPPNFLIPYYSIKEGIFQ